jgi:tetratricopeptide (TPR) repeat protein/predicted Ser/Thr protein kinase
MLDDQWKRAKELFSASLELPPADRERFFTAQSDPFEVVAEARSLLTNYLESPGYLEGVTAPLPDDESEVAQAFAGRRIGAWRLKRELGHGGMGVVWEAERDDGQFEQRAAVKLLRSSLFSERDRRRFREERQMLASLNHPSIARLLDGGMLEDGSPYLVMEYIDGTPIDQWCDRGQLTLRQRIELSLSVCAAVEYAHSQLIIHRDLKPANILVDRTGSPKLLDFGIAKLTTQDQDPLDTTRLLTPECASPEQVRGERMSTATDVFALGVLLYKLFTGQHPFAAAGANSLAALQAICEQEPRLPSSASVAQRREMRGELDAIILQALRKDPAERYSTVHALAADLRAWLDGLPVSAVRQTWWRRSSKAILRYKALSAAIGAAVLLLAAGIVVTSMEARRARRAEGDALAQRDRAENAQHVAQSQRDRAVASEKVAAEDRYRAMTAENSEAVEKDRAVAESRRADSEAASARSINEFLEDDLLGQASPNAQASPNNKPDPDLKVRTALDRAAERIKGKFDGNPLVEASIQQTLGQSYFDLGLYDASQGHVERAVELRRKALGDHAPETLASMDKLALVYEEQTHYPQAEAVYKQVLQARQEIFGKDSSETLDTEGNYAYLYFFMGRYPAAEAMLVEVVGKRRSLYPGQLQQLMVALDALTAVYNAEGKYALAKPIAIEALGLARQLHGDDHPDTLNCVHNLARVYRWTGELDKAEKLYSEQLERSRRVLGPEHPDTLIAVNDLAVVYRLEGRASESADMLRQLIEVDRRVLGEENASTLGNRYNLIMALESMGKYSEAEQLGMKNLESYRRVYGEEAAGTIASEMALATAYRALGKFTQAEALLVKHLEVARRVQGAGSSNDANGTTALGITYQDEGKDDLAEATLNEALALDRKVFGTSNASTIGCLTALGRLRLSQKRYAEAETLIREANKGAENLKTSRWDVFDRQSLLGAALLGQGKYAEAEPLLLGGYEGLAKLAPDLSAEANLPEAGQRLVRLYSAWGKADQAEEWQRKLESAKR